MEKLMKTIIMGLIMTIATAACATDAGYYRVWQGFKKTELTQSQFMNTLPAFMNETRNVYTGVLNNYLVAIPLTNKPAFVPDEFALVALRSEDDYKQIRATPIGQQYSESHWTVFNRENSKSAPYSNIIPEILEHNKAYDVVGAPVDWSRGHTTFYIGVKKSNISSADYLKWLNRHVNLVANSFKGKVLKGYIIIANDNYEVAFMNWESQSAMAEAFQTEEGKAIRDDAATYMDMLQFSEMKAFNGNSVETGVFYNTGM